MYFKSNKSGREPIINIVWIWHWHHRACSAPQNDLLIMPNVGADFNGHAIIILSHLTILNAYYFLKILAKYVPTMQFGKIWVTYWNSSAHTHMQNMYPVYTDMMLQVVALGLKLELDGFKSTRNNQSHYSTNSTPEQLVTESSRTL